MGIFLKKRKGKERKKFIITFHCFMEETWESGNFYNHFKNVWISCVYEHYFYDLCLFIHYYLYSLNYWQQVMEIEWVGYCFSSPNKHNNNVIPIKWLWGLNWIFLQKKKLITFSMLNIFKWLTISNHMLLPLLL